MRITAERMGAETAEDETAEPTVAPVYRARSELAHWLLDHDLDLRQAGKLFGTSHTTVQTIIRPFDDPEWRPPKLPLLTRIVEATRGDITGEHFIPPHLRKTPVRRAGDPVVLAAGRAG